MKVYVDELPNCCGNCGFCCKDDLGYWCQAGRIVYIADEFLGKKKLQCCPLQSLADHDKQVRKDVIEEIKKEVQKEKEDNDLAWLGFKKLSRILDQIQGETK